MARFGNFKNNKEYVDFLKEVKERGEANPKYKNIYRDVENIEVIVASLTGKQSPLRKKWWSKWIYEKNGKTCSRLLTF